MLLVTRHRDLSIRHLLDHLFQLDNVPALGNGGALSGLHRGLGLENRRFVLSDLQQASVPTPFQLLDYAQGFLGNMRLLLAGFDLLVDPTQFFPRNLEFRSCPCHCVSS